METIVQEFQDGVDAYWAGRLPDGWGDKEERERCPFLTGWYMASQWDIDEGFLVDEDGDPLQ
jgi:hypothetical protein